MSTIRPRGLLKGWFFASRLHYVVQPFQNVLDRLVYMSKLSRWITSHRDIPFSDFYSLTFVHEKRRQLYQYVLEREQLDGPIDYLEFGVSKGASFRWWVDANKHPESRFYGFDTFTGLPEDWGPFKKGDMSAGNRPPDISDPRCTFVPGLFQQTLPSFLRKNAPIRRKVIHLDADLYSATLFVLTTLAPHLTQNDILLFDEFNVPLHEFRAFSEFVESFYVEYEVLGAINNFYQVAVKLK